MPSLSPPLLPFPTSPTPWQVHRVDETVIIDANGRRVCEMFGDYYGGDGERMALDAPMIVEAVNKLHEARSLSHAIG